MTSVPKLFYASACSFCLMDASLTMMTLDNNGYERCRRSTEVRREAKVCVGESGMKSGVRANVPVEGEVTEERCQIGGHEHDER